MVRPRFSPPSPVWRPRSRSPSPRPPVCAIPAFSTKCDLAAHEYAPQGTVDYPGPPCPEVFRPSYLISIREARFQDLAQRMGPWMAHCRRAPCVVGLTLNKNQLYSAGTLARTGNSLKLGEIGCWLSHYNAWSAIARSPFEYGTLMEDDAAIACTLEVAAHVNQSVAELQEKKVPWDVLYWCISYAPHVAQGLQECGLTHWYRIPPHHCVGTVAYTIKTTVAQSWVQRAQPIRNPVDGWLCHEFEHLQVYCIKPILGTVVSTASDTAAG